MVTGLVIFAGGIYLCGGWFGKDKYDLGPLHMLDFKKLFQIQYTMIFAIILLYVGAMLFGARQ